MHTGGSKRISAEVHILSYIWFACNKVCLRDIAERFNIGISTLHRILERVTSYIISIAKNVIIFPDTEHSKAETALKFAQKQGFPDVLGIIDGTYINIQTPAGKLKSVYCNRHDMPSITLQAICDADKKFIDVFTGASGKIHDARVFKLSSIKPKLPAICGDHFHILGDSAYSIREYLLTPYRNYGNLNNREENYNKTFSGTRVLIENAFGLLKSRFRQLIRVDFHEVDKLSKFVIACCVLHNLCIDAGDFIEIETMEEEDNAIAIEEPDEVTLRMRGEAKRDRISAAIL
ncbi:hypothetical protein MML48_9g00005579 [Holotrichia oblita]|uniref:Uncharacterized protein n=1 Tax=Holotrichia oblita TaxID=644536 RepID=A0ACB9SKB0_HOLOL|nr:hypothetical protein MML48_9g00005579 [Holotrichia oblita]